MLPSFRLYKILKGLSTVYNSFLRSIKMLASHIIHCHLKYNMWQVHV